MPSNIRWYPTELPALTESATSTSAIDSSIRALQAESRAQAIRQSLSRRSAGILQARQQNATAIVIGSLMPLVIDPIARSQPATQTVSAVGTAGYVAGSSQTATAKSTDKIVLSTGAISSLGDKFQTGKQSRAAASSLTSAILAGGAVPEDVGQGTGEIYEFTFASEVAALLPSRLTYSAAPTWTNRPAGFSSQSIAFFMSTGCYLLDRFTFDLKEVSRSSVTTPGNHHGGASSTPSAGYFFGDRSRTNGGVWSLTFSTESSSYRPFVSGDPDGRSRQCLGNGSGVIFLFQGMSESPTFNYAYTVSSQSFAAISSPLPTAINSAARVGNSTTGYLCGGLVGAWHYWNTSYAVEAGRSGVFSFNYATQTVASNANSLTVSRSHPVGFSNYSGAFYG